MNRAVENVRRRAIEQKRRVRTNYTPVRPGVIGVRTLEPHALGYSKNGDALLRAWVHSGVSRTNVPRTNTYKARWRLFRVAQMGVLDMLPDQTFPTRPMYNYDGDRAMTRVVKKVPRPANTRQQAARRRHS